MIQRTTLQSCCKRPLSGILGSSPGNRLQVYAPRSARCDEYLDRLDDFFGSALEDEADEVAAVFMARRQSSWQNDQQSLVAAEPAAQNEEAPTQSAVYPPTDSDSTPIPSASSSPLSIPADQLQYYVSQRLHEIQNSIQELASSTNVFQHQATERAVRVMQGARDIETKMLGTLRTTAENASNRLHDQLFATQAALWDAMSALQRQREAMLPRKQPRPSDPQTNVDAASRRQESSSHAANGAQMRRELPYQQELREQLVVMQKRVEIQLQKLQSSLQELQEALRTRAIGTTSDVHPGRVQREATLSTRTVQRESQMQDVQRLCFKTRWQQHVQEVGNASNAFVHAQLKAMNDFIRQANAALQEYMRLFHDGLLSKVQPTRKASTTPHSTMPAQSISAPKTHIITDTKKQSKTEKAQQQRRHTSVAADAASQQELGTVGRRFDAATARVRTAVHALPTMDTDAARLAVRDAFAQRPTAAVAASAAAAATVIWATIRNRRLRKERAASEAAQNERSRRLLDLQKNRFRNALASSSEASTSADSSVFAAIANRKGGIAGNAAGDGTGDVDEDGTDYESTGLEDGDPRSWDSDTRREWDQFVRNSKLSEGKLWNADEVDEGLPQVWVDLNRD